jgi:hypothetical protein
MFHIVYRAHRCVDCGEPNPRPICECGYMREFTDQWWIVPHGEVTWYDGLGPWPRVHLPHDDLVALRDTLLIVGLQPGDDAMHAAFAYCAEAA